MQSAYRTILKENSAEVSIEKSRFIGYAAPAATEEEALAFVKRIKGIHPQATHNVHAYLVGEHNQIQRYSDDGEPSGTAGIPVLEVIKKEGLQNVAVVVTRYFGGIKLGAGGLVRAYTKGAKIGLEAGQIITKRLYRLLDIQAAYTLLGKLQNELNQREYYIFDTLYGETVHLQVYVQEDQVQVFTDWIVEMTSGRAIVTAYDQEYLNEMDGKILK